MRRNAARTKNNVARAIIHNHNSFCEEGAGDVTSHLIRRYICDVETLFNCDSNFKSQENYSPILDHSRKQVPELHTVCGSSLSFGGVVLSEAGKVPKMFETAFSGKLAISKTLQTTAKLKSYKKLI